MGKRSDYKRQARDFYRTPVEAVLPLTPHICDTPVFAEPFVGDGAIVRALEDLGYVCGFACDIQPEGEARKYAYQIDVMLTAADAYADCDVIISNPPFPAPRAGGEPTVGFIRHLIQIKPTWLLLPADFAHNVYASELIARHCAGIVSVGRVKWISGSKNTGKENAAWYLFKNLADFPARFLPIKRPLPRRGAIGTAEGMI